MRGLAWIPMILEPNAMHSDGDGGLGSKFMTLHVTTITPTHVITVCDRLLYTPGRYIELPDDRYKHFVLICDDAKVAVSFAGLAGIVNADSGGSDQIVNGTLDWLTDLATETSRSFHDIDSHLNRFRDCAQPHIEELRDRYGLTLNDMQLAIQICGWKFHTQFNCVIHNCLNRNGDAVDTKESFTAWIKTYDDEPFDGGSYVSFLGQRAVAVSDTATCDSLNETAALGNPKAIFDSSVALVRAAADKSPATIGTNCSGLRLTRDDPSIQVFDDRPCTIWDTVMPNIVKSTSGISATVKNMRGINKSNP